MSNDGGLTREQLGSLMQHPPYKGLIGPGRITTLPGLTDGHKRQFGPGVESLWQAIRTKPQNDPQHQAAIGKLRQVSSTLADVVKRHNQQQQSQQPQQSQQSQQSQPAQASQAGASRPQSQGQPQQGGNASQQRPQNATANGPSQSPEDIKKRVDNMPWTVPQGQPNPAAYIEELKRRYYDALLKQINFKSTLSKIQDMQQGGRDVPQNVLQQQEYAAQELRKAEQFIGQVHAQQSQARQAQQQQQSQQAARNANGAALNPNNAQNTQAQASVQQNMQQNASARQLPQNAQVEAARQQQVNRTSSGSPLPGQPSSTTAAQAPSSATSNQGNFQTPRQPQQGTSAAAFTQSPQTSLPPSASQQQSQQQPVPLTHQNAMDAAARSYSSTSAAPPQSASQSQATGQISMNRPEAERTATRWPIQKEFRPSAPQPVPVGASRPTLTAPSNGPMGMMGQPAIGQPPTYNLHGPGDRVLDKKKLDELVRQVCGGGDGSSPQGLQPEVEESVLQLADEFFDNVVTQACRLAKLRGSNTLEIRDIQLVLQKQYNIRVPGYATDEVRTVRKVQPTSSYLQKMNAVQAAKVMGVRLICRDRDEFIAYSEAFGSVG